MIGKRGGGLGTREESGKKTQLQCVHANHDS